MSKKGPDDTKEMLKKFHVFEKAELINKNLKDDSTNQIVNQVKNFKSTFIEPYIIFADLGAKLIFVLKPGDKYTVFTSFDHEVLYLKGTPYKNCPLMIIGIDFDGQNHSYKSKFYPWTELNKDKPSFVTLQLDKKGRNVSYDIFHINESYTCLSVGSSSGYIRVMTSQNFLEAGPVREFELHLESQVVKHILSPVCQDLMQQTFFYVTQNGTYYVGKLGTYERLYGKEQKRNIAHSCIPSLLCFELERRVYIRQQ